MLKLDYPFKKSPNHAPRRVKPTVIVLHSSGGSYESALDWLCRPESHVSAHFVVGRDGRVTQLVSLDRVAWHAGRSAFDGRYNVNEFSFGIEQAHIDGREGWPDAQVKATAAICAELMRRYEIREELIVSHAAVGLPSGRKIDPHLYPWPRFRTYLAERLQQTAKTDSAYTAQIGTRIITGKLIDDRLYVPIREVLDTLNIPSTWIPEKRRLLITPHAEKGITP